jgi:hypothetical protein
MCLRQQFVAVDKSDLELRKVGVEPAPKAIPGLVVVHVLGKGHTRELVMATFAQVGPVGVPDELHRVRSTTA